MMQPLIKKGVMRRKQSGSILILVLIITATLTAVAFSLAYRCQVELKLSGMSSKQTQLQYLAYGGIQRCLSMLATETLEPKQTLKAGYFFSSAQDEGFWDSTNSETEDDANVFYWITDEYSYLSINNSDPSFWEKTGLLDRSQISTIQDWIDSDDQTNPEGAENDYYQRLESPVLCKNTPIVTIREIMNVKGMSISNYSAPLASAFSNLPNHIESAALQDAINQAANESIPLFFSAHGDGKVNINTAGLHTLSILPGLDESTAETLLRHRAGADGALGTEDDNCTESAGEISNIDGLSELEIELLRQYCCFNSDMFRVFSYAKDDNHDTLLMATIKIVEDEPFIVSIERLL